MIDLSTHGLDDAHGLVTQDVPLSDERAHDLVEMEVGAADPAARDPDDCVRGLLNGGVGNVVYPDITSAVVGDGPHV